VAHRAEEGEIQEGCLILMGEEDFLLPRFTHRCSPTPNWRHG
jgi:hypothetical protein